MKELYDNISFETSRMVTHRYSTSFSLGIHFFDPKVRKPIYAIYGFVRLADEIVDSFHGYDKKMLLDKFRSDTYNAISIGISLNPVLHSFQKVVNEYGIDKSLIDAFLHSMEMDLYKYSYTQEDYEKYIYGSAEVVGLMCLFVFCSGQKAKYEYLKPFAMRLGSAYQKINFLRDLSADFHQLGRVYFPNINLSNIDESVKKELIADIELDFRKGYEGILRLPANSRFGVYLSYIYYYSLFNKIKLTPIHTLLRQRVRISNKFKLYLMFGSYVKNKLHLIKWQN